MFTPYSASKARDPAAVGYALFGAVVASAVFLAPEFPNAGWLGARWTIQCAITVAGATLLYAWIHSVRVRNAADGEDESLPAEPQLTEDAYHAKLHSKRQHILDALGRDVDALAAGNITVRQLMSTKLTTVPPTATVAQMRSLMHGQGLRHLLVTRSGKLVGVVSNRDFAKRGRTAWNIMSPRPLTVPPDMLVSPAVTLLTRKCISCLPVVDDGELVGLFTTTDLIMALQCSFQLLQSVAPYLEPAAADASRDREVAAAAAGA